MLMRVTARAVPVSALRADAPAHCSGCAVREVALFGALDPATLDGVHGSFALPELAAEQAVYTAGRSGGSVYTVRHGIVRFERIAPEGRRRIVRLAGRGDLIGLEALVGQPHAEDAVACTPVRLCRLPRALVDGLAVEQAALRRELMRRWQRALDEAVAWAAELAVGPAPLRMLRLLARLHQLAGDDDVVWLPRRDQMADMLDLTVETASRLVSRLRRDGVIAELLPPRQARLDAQALQQALQRALR